MSYTGSTPKFDSVEGDNIKVDGNTISSTNENGDINLAPNGTGKVTVPTPSQGDNSTSAASTAYVDAAADQTLLDANTYTDDQIAAIPPGEVATVANVGTGAGVYKEKVGYEFKLKSLVAGSNVTITENEDDLTISSPVEASQSIAALNIDWSLGNLFYKDLSTSSTFTFSNLQDGKTISVAIRNTSGADITITLPSVIKSSTFVNVVKASNKETVFTFMRMNGKTYAASIGDMN